MNARFFCTDLTCGRGFHSEEDLKTHMFRRHGQVVVEVPDVNEKQEEIKKRIFGSYTLADKPVRVQELTSELILDVSGQDSIDDVTEV